MPAKKATPASLSQPPPTQDLHGRVGSLETRMTAAEDSIADFQRTVTMNTDAVQAGARISAENALTLQKILLFVSGQQEPGLKVPGIAERMEAMHTKMEAMESNYNALKTADTARKGWIAGVAAAITVFGGWATVYFWDFLHGLYLLVKSTHVK